MFKTIQLLPVTFLLMTTFSNSQTNMAKPEEPPYIEVTGTAKKEIVPDEIYIAIIIHERYVNKEKISIEEQETKLKNAIKSLGLDLADLSLSDANADYVKIRWQKKEVLTKKDYTLKVSNATLVGLVFAELEKLEITDAYISKVDHSKMDNLKKEVKIEAIKAAKEKADYLLAAISEQTGKPLVIVENEISPVYGMENVNVRGSRDMLYVDGVKVKSEDDDNAIQFQKIKIQSSIYVKFSIK